MKRTFLLFSVLCSTTLSFAATPGDEASSELSSALSSSLSLDSDASGPYLRPNSRVDENAQGLNTAPSPAAITAALEEFARTQADSEDEVASETSSVGLPYVSPPENGNEDMPPLEPNPSFTGAVAATAAEGEDDPDAGAATGWDAPLDENAQERLDCLMNLARKVGRDPENARKRFLEREALQARGVKLYRDLLDDEVGLIMTDEGVEEFTNLFFEYFPEEREHCFDLWKMYDAEFEKRQGTPFFSDLCCDVLDAVESTPLKNLIKESNHYKVALKWVHAQFALQKAEERGLIGEGAVRDFDLEVEVLEALKPLTNDFAFQNHWKSVRSAFRDPFAGLVRHWQAEDGIAGIPKASRDYGRIKRFCRVKDYIAQKELTVPFRYETGPRVDTFWDKKSTWVIGFDQGDKDVLDELGKLSATHRYQARTLHICANATDGLSILNWDTVFNNLDTLVLQGTAFPNYSAFNAYFSLNNLELHIDGPAVTSDYVLPIEFTTLPQLLGGSPLLQDLKIFVNGEEPKNLKQALGPGLLDEILKKNKNLMSIGSIQLRTLPPK